MEASPPWIEDLQGSARRASPRAQARRPEEPEEPKPSNGVRKRTPAGASPAVKRRMKQGYTQEEKDYG
jgi:hypothetical protein